MFTTWEEGRKRAGRGREEGGKREEGRKRAGRGREVGQKRRGKREGWGSRRREGYDRCRETMVKRRVGAISDRILTSLIQT